MDEITDTDQGPALLDPDEVTRSLTGFEEIAISHHFRKTLGELANHDETMAMRALLFVVAKRDGAADGDAFRNTMLQPLGDVVDRFVSGEGAGELGEA